MEKGRIPWINVIFTLVFFGPPIALIIWIAYLLYGRLPGIPFELSMHTLRLFGEGFAMAFFTLLGAWVVWLFAYKYPQFSVEAASTKSQFRRKANIAFNILSAIATSTTLGYLIGSPLQTDDELRNGFFAFFVVLVLMTFGYVKGYENADRGRHS